MYTSFWIYQIGKRLPKPFSKTRSTIKHLKICMRPWIRRYQLFLSRNVENQFWHMLGGPGLAADGWLTSAVFLFFAFGVYNIFIFCVWRLQYFYFLHLQYYYFYVYSKRKRAFRRAILRVLCKGVCCCVSCRLGWSWTRFSGDCMLRQRDFANCDGMLEGSLRRKHKPHDGLTR